jgi:colanic acid/amylovoran biosynthesis glycosyltransferase
LVEKKGFRYAIEAFSRVSMECPEAVYDIIGEGPMRENLQQLISALKLTARVRLLGWKTQEQVIECMEAADLFVAPSVTAASGDQEGIPVVLMEAMAMGLPVLSTHHSGIPELVAHGRNGYLVAEKDIGALASAIVRAIQNPAERSAVGEAARLRVEDAFDVKVQNQRLMDLYRGLTNSVPS